MEQTYYNPIPLTDRTLLLPKGSTLGISSNKKDDIKQLLANLYLQQFPDAFYLEHHGMIYETMTVLEYLVFVNRLHSTCLLPQLQLELLTMLTDCDLGHLSLTPIALLTSAEKMLILFASALCSDSNMILFEVSKYTFSTPWLLSMKAILGTLKRPETTVIITTSQPQLIGICLSHTIFLQEEKPIYFGSIQDLYESMDRVLYVLQHQEQAKMIEQLNLIFPDFEIRNNHKLIFVMRTTSERDDKTFFETLSAHQVFPDRIKINHGKVENSFQELIEFHAVL